MKISMFLVLLGSSFSFKAHATEAVVMPNISIENYDCSVITVRSHGGKCTMGLSSEFRKKPTEFLASPEVAAPWSNSYGEASSRPMSGLTMTFEGNEIVRIEDSNGRKITTKIDFSR